MDNIQLELEELTEKTVGELHDLFKCTKDPLFMGNVSWAIGRKKSKLAATIIDLLYNEDVTVSDMENILEQVGDCLKSKVRVGKSK